MATIFQDSALTNAGTGSSLTINGTVECDASLMDGQSLTFGAVGALPGYQQFLSLFFVNFLHIQPLFINVNSYYHYRKSYVNSHNSTATLLHCIVNI